MSTSLASFREERPSLAYGLCCRVGHRSEAPSGTRTKVLDDLGSLFLGAGKPGDSMEFTFPVVAAGRYELLAELVVYPGYGIVRLAVDGKPVGAPFDAYAPELDASDAISFGVLDLAAGEHRLQVEVIGKNEKATGHMISLKRFYLKPSGK